MNYQVSLTEEQVKVVGKACELLCRVHLGQLKEVADLFNARIPATNIDESIDKYHQLKDALIALSPLVTGMESPHASFGVGNPNAHPDHAMATVGDRPSGIAYEIWRTIENYMQPHDFMREPLKISSEPISKIEGTG